MSRQQINLYSPIFRKEKKKFSAEAMVQGAGAVLLGIIVIYGFNYWRVSSLKDALAQAGAQQTAAMKRLQNVTQKFGVVGKSKVVLLQEEITAREHIRARLKSGATGNDAGYSDFFVALARQHVPGLWLTSFQLQGTGESLVLEGRTRAPELVPRYIQRLSSEKTFAGREFHVFSMSRPEKSDGPYIEFMVKTNSDGGTK